MANPFDQFDTGAAPQMAAGANPFDQFDVKGADMGRGMSALQGFNSVIPFGNRLTAGMGAIGASALGDGSISENYKQARENQKQTEAAHPGANMAGSLAGVAATLPGAFVTGGGNSLPIIGKLADAAQTGNQTLGNFIRGSDIAQNAGNLAKAGKLIGQAGRSALVAAPIGGVYGYGAGEEGQRIDAARKNAELAAGVGAAVPLAVAGLGAAGSTVGGVANRIGSLIGKESSQANIADNILAKRLVGEGYSPEKVSELIAKAKASGLNPTLGEATQSSGVLQAEKSIIKGTGEGSNALREAIFARNRDAIPNTINSFADKLDKKAGDISAAYDAAGREAHAYAPRVEAQIDPKAAYLENLRDSIVPSISKPKTLTQRVRELGGVTDIGGDLKGRVPVGVINQNGKGLDDMARALKDEGYFHHIDEPQVNDLLNALDDEALGSFHVKPEDMAQLSEWENQSNNINDVIQEMDKLGLDTTGKNRLGLQSEINKIKNKITPEIQAPAEGDVAGSTVFDINNNITNRLKQLGDVNNEESLALKQAKVIINNANKRGNDFDALLDAKKQLDNLFIEGADTATRRSASRYVATYSNQINNSLKKMAPTAYPQALTSAKTGKAAEDIREALNSTNEGSLGQLYNKIWAKPELRQDFLNKLPDEATRAEAKNLFAQLENVKRGFGDSGTAWNTSANKTLEQEAGTGIDPELTNPMESIASFLKMLGGKSVPGVYKKMAEQSINPDVERLVAAMQKISGGGGVNGAPISGAAAALSQPREPLQVPINKGNAYVPDNSIPAAPANSFGNPQPGGALSAPVSGPQSQNNQPSNDLFARVIYQESRGNQAAVSPKGAVGVAQLLPATAKEMAQEMGVAWDPIKFRLDARYNAALGKAYLSKMQDKYGHDALALMAYNWGPGNVDLWLKSGANVDRVPKETKNYVKNILMASL